MDKGDKFIVIYFKIQIKGGGRRREGEGGRREGGGRGREGVVLVGGALGSVTLLSSN